MHQSQRDIKKMIDAGERDARAAPNVDTLEAIFDLWTHLERRNQDFIKLPHTQAEVEIHNNNLFEAQERLMSTATTIRSKNDDHIAYKIALWRWDAPELDQRDGFIQRSDKVAYSAFKDLVRITGLHKLLRKQDVPGR